MGRRRSPGGARSEAGSCELAMKEESISVDQGAGMGGRRRSTGGVAFGDWDWKEAVVVLMVAG